jgi:DNA-binding NtrC family response regulator
MPTVLVVDDDRSIRHQLQKALDHLELVAVGGAEEGLKWLKTNSADCVLLDIILPETSGLEVFKQIKTLDNKLPVIFITAGSSSETTIQAMQLGAYDYLVKPLNLPAVKDLVNKALETRRMMSVPVAIPKDEAPPASGDYLVGKSEPMLKVYTQVGRVAAQDVIVLIRGESGTGKELIARAIYQHSPRASECFLAVNCAALPDNLLESELFGHEKGAFTGAHSRRIGKFEQCNGGTLFLDEVGDMALTVQSKVLRLLQEQRFERVGGNETIQTDVRIIAATNRDLEEMVEKGDFREDLFYRLNGFTINLPPLRERQSDLPQLIQHFLARLSPQLGKSYVEGISPEATELLTAYDWPGNIRELQSVIRQSLLNSTGPVIVPDFLPPEVRSAASAQTKPAQAGPSSPGDDESYNLKLFLDEQLSGPNEPDNLHAETIEFVERYLLMRVLDQAKGNQSQASRILGITRGSLRNKIRTLGISIEQVVHVDDEDD